jgi:hypothetical protein
MEEVNAIVRDCDVVLLCFNMAGQRSLHSAISTWLPHISSVDKEVPIIVVGCKEDQAIVTEAEITVRACYVFIVGQSRARGDPCSLHSE